MEWIAHCQCRLTMDDTTGEPVDFLRRCELHPNATPEDIAAESRALSLVKKAISEATGVEMHEVEATIIGRNRRARGEGPGGVSVEFKKVSLAEYREQHAEAVKRVRKA